MTNWQAGEPASHFATAAPQSRGIGPKHRTSILLSRAGFSLEKGAGTHKSERV